jgi:hypothetical protein
MGTAVQTKPARLLIHARAAGATGANVLQRLRALIRGSAHPNQGEALRLHIDDLEGRCLLVLDDAGPMIDVPLPAGTYHVFAGVASEQRCYTMTLEPGLPFTLALPFSARRG